MSVVTVLFMYVTGPYDRALTKRICADEFFAWPHVAKFIYMALPWPHMRSEGKDTALAVVHGYGIQLGSELGAK